MYDLHVIRYVLTDGFDAVSFYRQHEAIHLMKAQINKILENFSYHSMKDNLKRAWYFIALLR
jgi:hypothetical protein